VRQGRRNRWLDHIVRAAVRYDQADGSRLSAAIIYYAFFATFALTLLGFAVFGFVLDTPSVAASVQRYLTQNLPRLDVPAVRHARRTAGVIAFIGLPVTGWFWINALRSSIRKVWQLPEYPGALPIRVAVDLLVLIGLGLLLAASLTVAFVTTALAGRLVTTVGSGIGGGHAGVVTPGRSGGCLPAWGSWSVSR
jgi:membrane protein